MQTDRIDRFARDEEVDQIMGDLRRYTRRGFRNAEPLAANDLLSWGRLFLPQHFRLPPSAMHRWLAERLDAMRTRRGMQVNVLGPRGAAKSTLGALAFVLRAAVEGWEPYIWIVSDTKRQAHGHLENVKLELVDNPRLARAYPRAVGQGKVWRSAAALLRNETLIEAFGTGQPIRGRRRRENRPTLIVCDDLQNDRHIESALARRRSQDWFHGALLKAGTKDTNVVHLATALHRDALALELHAAPGWDSRIFRALEAWPANMPLWQEWEAIYANADDPQAAAKAWEFYRARQAAMDEGAQPLWPEHEDLYGLMRMRVESGRAAFEREKQNSPINPDLCEWPETYFGPWIWFEDWPGEAAVKIVALDPSKGPDSQRGDYSAFALLAVDPGGVMYLDADLARRQTPQIVAEGVEHCRRFRPHALAIETNQFQQLLADDFQEEFVRRRVVGVPVWTLENRVNKVVRIRRLGPLLSARRLRFKSGSPGAKLLVEQLQVFPIGAHDDGPDAAEMAIRLAGELASGST